MISGLRLRFALILFSLSAAALSAQADPVDQFGLHHSVIGQAVFTNGDYGLEVIGLRTNGMDGLSSELGQADSGVFIYPNTRYVDWDYSMTSRFYGSLNGQSNTLIGTVYGYRLDYGQFYAGADYSPIGATNVTFQLWRGNLLLAESTVSNGEVYMYAEYASPPRVNPWWRQANGEYGASIEFRFPLPVSLPGVREIYGDRIFLRPNGATGAVDYISRTDVFAGGGLDHFSYTQMRLGMFGHPHLALNGAKFVARPGMLKLDEIVPGEEEGGGVIVEFAPSEQAALRLEPLEIAIPNTNDLRHRVELTAAGWHNGYPSAIGSLYLANLNGVLEFTPYIYEDGFSTMEIFSNNVLVSSSVVLLPWPALRIDGAPRLTSFSATADTLAGAASMGFGFDTNATITLTNGTQIVGDRIVVRASQSLGFADISSLGLIAHELPSFTLVGETNQPLVLPRLEISQSGTNVTLRWPDPAGAYKVERSSSLEGFFSAPEFTPSYSNGIATVRLCPTNEVLFFRVRRDSYD
jgi:hypothetical protein